MDHKIPSISSSLLVLVLVLLSSLLLLNVLTPLQPLTLVRLASLSPPPSFTSASSKCDYSNGRWVLDENYNIGSYAEDCPFLDPGFQCIRCGRKDTGYRNWRWQPHGCDLPRFNASEMLERSRNKRIVFAGDSIGRNQWESLLCMLSTAVKNKSRVYEASGNPIGKHLGSLSVRFSDFNLTVEYFRSPFLVVIDRPPPNSPHDVYGAIRVDTPQWQCNRWAGADVIIFNTGHWWSDDKTIHKAKYFQIGKTVNMKMDVKTAFRITIETIGNWALKNMELEKSFFLFRSYSPSHYRNGTWDNGGNCDMWTSPESNRTRVSPDPWFNRVIVESIQGMRGRGMKAHFLNITHLTELRPDGHPSSHREPGTPVDAPQDCSHWCLPGVPDTWNELMYAHLLSNGYGAQNKRLVPGGNPRVDVWFKF